MSEGTPARPLVRWSALVLLTLIAVFAAIDRQLPFILAEPIKQDLGLSDGQLGLIGGAAFAIFYTALVLPAAQLADWVSRKWVIVGAVALWSAMTALAGAVTSFAQMFAARIGVAVGESGCNAPSHAMISALFPPAQRATALSVYALAGTIGAMAGFGLGGWMADALGWRGAFMAFGIPGVALAVVAAMLLPASQGATPRTPESGLVPAFRAILHSPALLWLIGASSLYAFVAQGVMAWLSPLLIRTHGLTTAEAGVTLALPVGLAGSLGIVVGGVLTDRLGARDIRWRLRAPAIALVVSTPILLYALNAPSAGHFMAAAAVGMVLSAFPVGATYAMVQHLAHPAQRATTAAVVILFSNLVGGLLGPPIAGFLSDALQPTFGVAAIRWAVSAVCLAYLASAALYLVAARRLEPVTTEA